MFDISQGKQWARQLRQRGKHVVCSVYPNAAHPLATAYADYDRWCTAGVYTHNIVVLMYIMYIVFKFIIIYMFPSYFPTRQSALKSNCCGNQCLELLVYTFIGRVSHQLNKSSWVFISIYFIF